MRTEDYKEFKKLKRQLRPLFFLQEKLDAKIRSRFTYDEELRREHLEKKELAFRVEVAELLNALRYHKYWSRKASEEQDRDHILEEYVDGLHFLLSMAIERGMKDYDYRGVYDEGATAEELTHIFTELLTKNWLGAKNEEFILGLELYLKLGEILLFSWEEIKDAYTKKNIINQERQDSAY